MKKLLLALAVVTGVFAALAGMAAADGVNEFTIQNYQIDYYLGQDSSGRSTLKTVETIQAVFPDTDQNHGIERAVPTKYDGHSVKLQFQPTTNARGGYVTQTKRTSNGNAVLRLGDAGSYVHGLQTYKLTYTENDVTKYFSNTNDDEFYWDTNGTGWAVPIQSLTARVHLTPALASKLSDKQQCYVGKANSNTPCEITKTADGYTATVNDLNVYENMTIAVGFQPHTFSAYKASRAETLLSLWVFSTAVTLPLSFILGIWLLVLRHRRIYRKAEIRTIIPEYTPPANASVSTAASILQKSGSVFSAQLIDLAVRKYIKIYQTREKSLFRPANYELEIIQDPSSLRAEEREILDDMFDVPAVGSKLDMSTLKRNRGVSVKLSDNNSKLQKYISGEYALRARDPKQSRWFKRAGLVILGLSVVLLSVPLLITAVISLIISATIKPLTDSGLELARYLKGLEMYIKVAEADRIRMLQSPEGALKLPAPIDTNDKRKLIKLYELVLPYAILFGQEKKWNNQLGQYYENTNESPSWYVGSNGIFNAAVFSSAMNGFGQVATYSDPSSSSSGGSGGGGFSGGGGGGGGGGGW